MANANRPLRVLYYEHPEPGMGGSRRSLLFLVRGLGDDVRPYIVGNLPPEVAKDLPVHSVVWKSPVGLWRRTRRAPAVKTLEWLAYAGSMAVRLAAVILRHRIDIVHVNNEVTSGAPAILAAILARRPCVCHLRGTCPPWCETRWLFSHVDHYIAISECVRNYYASQGLLDAKPVSVVYNGAPVRELADRCASRPPTDPAAFSVGTLGRMNEYKGHDYFLDVAREVAQRWPRIRFVIHAPIPVSSDPSWPYYAHLRDMVEASSLCDTIQFAGAYAEVADVMRTTDAVLCCSPYDNFGRVLFEAMACGVPVVAFDVGGVREVVEHGRNGLLVSNRDAKAMAEAVIQLCESRRLREDLAREGQATARRHFDNAVNAQRVLRIYEGLLNR